MSAKVSITPQEGADARLSPWTANAVSPSRPVERKVAAGFVLAFAILVSVALVQHWTIGRFVENDRRLVRTNQVLAEMEGALSGVRDAEAGLRSYIMIGREEFPPLRPEVVQDVTRHLRTIRQLTSGNPRQQRRLDLIEPLVAARFATLQHIAELAQNRNSAQGPHPGNAQGIAAIRQFIIAGGGWQGLEEIRQIVADMEAEEQHSLSQWTALAESSARLTTWSGLLGSLAALALAVLAALFFRNDLPRRRRAEQLLQASEERFRTLTEQVRDYAIFMLDPEGRVVSWNTGAEQIKGYRADEILGEHFSRFYPPEDRDSGKPEEALRIAIAEGRYETGGWRLRRDGSRFWARVLITAMRDPQGRLIGFSKITRDLTERQRAEDALRASEERFRSVAESANDAFISSDEQGNIVHWNQGAGRIFGYTAAEAIGQPITLIMPQRFRAAHELGLYWYLQAQEKHVVGRTSELTGLRKDSTEIPIELSLSSWKTADGSFFTGIIRDITERKRTEREIKMLNDGLQSRNEDLAAANKELEAFSYSVSHDLRAPLRHIDGFSKLLLEEHGTELSAQARDFLNLVREATSEMSQLVDDLLNLSRVGRQELTLQVTDLDAVVRDMVSSLQAEHSGRSLQFLVQPLPPVECDLPLLKQVFANLLSNAVKFTRPRSPAVIEVSSFFENGRPVFVVRDNGVGFDMKHVDKLFGVFQRLHRQEDFEGTGVGLAIVQRIVHKHGGRIWVQAQPDQGASFYFTLAPPTLETLQDTAQDSAQPVSPTEANSFDGEPIYGHSLSRR